MVSILSKDRCALLDTGAQVSCLIADVLSDGPLELTDCGGMEIIGVGNGKSSILGKINLTFLLGDLTFKHNFVVVPSGSMNFCCIFGADLMEAHNFQLNFSEHKLIIPMGIVHIPTFKEPITTLGGHTCALRQSLITDQSNSHMIMPLDRNELLELQKHNQLSQLRKMIQTPIQTWSPSIKRYQRYRNAIKIVDDVMLYERGNVLVPVIPFNFLVEVCLLFHHRRAHPGRQKLIDDVMQHLWHPSIAAVASDVTRTCDTCQRVKVAGVLQPPTTKIQTSSPFELLTIDLLALPTTKKRNSCCLVAVDHYSKWLSVVPLPNKTSVVVSSALENQILPSLLKVPQKILSDNGPEFRAAAFADVLDRWSITHIRTTAYKPTSNGLVERTNRTLSEILRSLRAEYHDWDMKVPSAVMMYNGSTHSELKESPSSFLLRHGHRLSTDLRLPATEGKYWKQGNPAFKPFKRGNMVLRKVVFTGRNLSDKLEDRYSGPYKIVKVNLNRVTYIIKGLSDGREHKVHHTQLRRYYLAPNYLLNHSSYDRIVLNDTIPRDESPIVTREPSSDQPLISEDCYKLSAFTAVC